MDFHYIGTDGIDAIPALMAKGIAITNTACKSMYNVAKEGWYIKGTPYKKDEKTYGPFDYIVFAMAAP